MKSGYKKVEPLATYSPWYTDEAFSKAHGRIVNHTMLDIYRCYELWQLVEQSAKLEKGDLLEVGVWKGGSGVLIALQAERCWIDGCTLLCDTFEGVVKAGPNDSHYKEGKEYKIGREFVDELLHPLSVRAVVVKGVFPDETGEDLSFRRFRFCHIDVDVYQSGKDVLDWVWPRMVPGGIVVFDDYGFAWETGIAKLVNEHYRDSDKLVIHNLNGHAIMVKR